MERFWKNKIGNEIKKQILVAGPLFVVGLLQFSLQFISLTFVGHLRALELAGASLATSFASVTGFNLLMGLASSLDTLCGQSFGAGQHHMVGIHTQRAMVVLTVVSGLLAVIWANTRPILLILDQNPEISKVAGLYACFMIPSLFAFAILQCLTKFLQTQNNVIPMVVSSGITAILHAVICWFLVFKSGLRSRGAAMANSISYWINVLLLSLYVMSFATCKTTWTGFSKEAFHKIFSFLKIAIPSAIMLCLKVWTFEIIVILAGLLPNPKLETSVLSICFNTLSFVWVIPFGLGAAVSTRVSNELGAGNSEAACLAANVVVYMAIVEGSLVGLVIVLLRNTWGNIYSNDKDVIRSVDIMMPFLALCSFFDSIQSVLSGVARGSGWQNIGAYVNLGSFYFMGLPCAVLLAFVAHMKAKGLWLGIVLALAVQSVVLLIITKRTNWEKEINEAAKRVNDSRVPEDKTATQEA